jgi:hypothetical protein
MAPNRSTNGTLNPPFLGPGRNNAGDGNRPLSNFKGSDGKPLFSSDTFEVKLPGLSQ